MKIIWSPLAVERMQEIVDYISLDNMDASIRWAENIFNNIEKLIDFPESGRIVPETKRNDIKEIVLANYRLIYRIEKNRIIILTIRHFKQILPTDDLTMPSKTDEKIT
ncbi:type II toxin-antitoxin system RelE/ParE family toxin [candidate division KSB1 bacterium]|nr:type II toxin-antitoxin system RelE/ParE family toxin [candidate division KSB1 bacterium]